jgi:hypothetical protein
MDRYAIKLGKAPPELPAVRVIPKTWGKIGRRRDPNNLFLPPPFVPVTEKEKTELNNLSTELWRVDVARQDMSILSSITKNALRKERQETVLAFLKNLPDRYKLLRSNGSI